MNIVWQVVYLLLWIFRLMLLGRIIVEFVRMFARSWKPVGVPAVGMEVLYTATDPPVKLFRRLIPALRLGGVGFDLSVLILFLIVWILMQVAGSLALAS